MYEKEEGKAVVLCMHTILYDITIYLLFCLLGWNDSRNNGAKAVVTGDGAFLDPAGLCYKAFLSP